jgi:hypothetical protein
MPNNVVGPDDRVEGGAPEGSAGLPPELQGKTQAEIIEWYNDRERTILDNARRMVDEAHREASQPPAPEERKPVPPNATPMTQADFERMTGPARDSLIRVAQMDARLNKPDWDRLLPDIRKIMDNLPADQQMNARVWEEAYYNVRGHITDTLISEARNRALGLESAPPPTPPPVKPRQLDSAEMRVCEGCGIDTEAYIKAEERLNAGYQPFTVDNRRRIGAQ